MASASNQAVAAPSDLLSKMTLTSTQADATRSHTTTILTMPADIRLLIFEALFADVVVHMKRPATLTAQALDAP